MTKTTPKMPALFLGHGNPMYAIDPNHYTDGWRQLAQALPRPKAILAISAHWYIDHTAVTAMARPRTIHDFGGFPKALFDVQYPAPGSPELAQRIQQLLAPLEVRLDHEWGLDHGAWSVLLHLYPQADIPVIQLSIDATQPAAWHHALAQQLRPLRDEGVLILGSGNIVHNLGRLNWSSNAPAHAWAERFSEWVRTQLRANNHDALIGYLSHGEDAHLSIPTPDHYLPLIYVIAQQQPGEKFGLPMGGIDMGAIDMQVVTAGMG
jgi:4,5-DOPA dioxygenase extradiol